MLDIGQALWSGSREEWLWRPSDGRGFRMGLISFSLWLQQAPTPGSFLLVLSRSLGLLGFRVPASSSQPAVGNGERAFSTFPFLYLSVPWRGSRRNRGILCEEQQAATQVANGSGSLQAMSPLVHRKKQISLHVSSQAAHLSHCHRSLLFLFLLLLCFVVGLVCLHLNGGFHTHQVSVLPLSMFRTCTDTSESLI